jgi:hypothetical protein
MAFNTYVAVKIKAPLYYFVCLWSTTSSRKEILVSIQTFSPKNTNGFGFGLGRAGPIQQNHRDWLQISGSNTNLQQNQVKI